MRSGKPVMVVLTLGLLAVAALAQSPDDVRQHKENFFEIWHMDQWYRVAEEDEQRGILINGKFVELKMGNNRWLVP